MKANTVAHGLATVLWGYMHLTGAQRSPNHKMECVRFNSFKIIKEFKFIISLCLVQGIQSFIWFRQDQKIKSAVVKHNVVDLSGDSEETM